MPRACDTHFLSPIQHKTHYS